MVRALATITSLLPDPYRDDPQIYDHLPHGSIALLLLASQLPELLGTLLRNDSVTDWTNRSDVYNSMLSLLRRMSDCELTIEVSTGFYCALCASLTVSRRSSLVKDMS